MSSSQSKKPFVRLLTITPERAARWLKRNSPRNRKQKPTKIAGMESDMSEGRFLLNDQAISFNVKKRLINGQHRLQACVNSGKSFVSIVLFNMPSSSMLVIDGGMKRTTDDHFQIAGRSYPRQCGGTVRRLLMGMKSYAGRAMTDMEVDEFMKKYAEAVAFAHEVVPTGRYGSASVRAPITRAYINKVDKDRLRKFGEVLTSGIMDRGDEAAVVLRNKITDMSLGGGRERSKLYAWTESAIQSFMANRRPKALEAVKEEVFPIPGESEWLVRVSLPEPGKEVTPQKTEDAGGKGIKKKRRHLKKMEEIAGVTPAA